MKYRDLPNQEAILRLTAYAFVRDGADESVFKFHRSIAPAYEFYNNQRAKIVGQYGDKDNSGNVVVSNERKDECITELTALIDSDVGFRIADLDIEESDFLANKCRKPSEASLLLSSAEKEAILRLSEIIKHERKIEKLNEVKSELQSITAP